MTSEQDMEHAGAIWHYNDARGVHHIGHFISYSDFGGSDVPYTFRDCATGEFSVVSGQRLRDAGIAHGHACEIRDRILAELTA